MFSSSEPGYASRKSSSKCNRSTLVSLTVLPPSREVVDHFPIAHATVVPGLAIIAIMVKVFDKQRLRRTRRLMRGEQLHKLKFSEAFDQTLSMMALLIDMTASFTSPSEFRRLPNYCGSLPPARHSRERLRTQADRAQP